VDMVHGSDQRGATDKNSQEATKHAMTGLRAISWEQRLLGVLRPPVLHSGKRACALAGRRWMR